MSNSVIQKPKFSIAIQQEKWQQLINNTLGDPNRSARFVSAISSAVGTTPALQDCDAGSVLTGALLGETLNLAHSPQLGQYYLVPFGDKQTGVKKAQFVMGYKGYIQLAIRSGNYAKISVLEIKEGEFRSFNPLTEVLDCIIVTDPDKREMAPTVGYYTMLETKDGFQKVLYWTKSKMERHADKYSPAFHLHAIKSDDPKKSRVSYKDYLAGNFPQKEAWKYSSLWYQNFDDMAKKTMIRQLISKWGPMSTEMQQAYTADNMEIVHTEYGFDALPIGEDEASFPSLVPPMEPEAEGIGEPMSLDDFEE